MNLSGSYDQIKIVAERDYVEIASAMTEDLTLVANEATAPQAAQATFVAVPEIDENAYKIGIMGVSPKSTYFISIKESRESNSIIIFGSNADENGNRIPGENSYSTGTGLKNKVENGYYLVYDCSNYTLSQNNKTLTYTRTKYGDWTKCRP